MTVQTLYGRATALLLAALLVVTQGCSVQIVKPGWQDAGGTALNELTLNVKAGEQAKAGVKFVAGDNDSNGFNIAVKSDEAPGWVSVDPPRLAKVDMGATYPLAISVSVPADTKPGSYGASVSLLTGTKLVSKLPVRIVVQ